jgi:hypothetical protein
VIEPIGFEALAPGDIFFVDQPYKQYFVKLETAEDGINAEELEGGKRVQFRPSERFPIYPDDGGRSWEGPKRL